MRCANSSKQNRKNKCGYQCRQKCHHHVENCTPSTLARAAERACTRQRVSIIAATVACVARSRNGCSRFPANTTINTLETPKYTSAIHSNAPQAADTSPNCFFSTCTTIADSLSANAEVDPSDLRPLPLEAIDCYSLPPFSRNELVDGFKQT